VSEPSPVQYERRGHVVTVTLNRPAVHNALDLRTHAALAEAWDAFEADGEAWVAVLAAAGDRSFCAGQDLKELAARIEQGVPPSTFGSYGAPGWPRLTERFELTKPIVARVSGAAYGGGFELVLACDIAVAVDTAVFALPEVKLGLVAGAGGVFRLARQLPVKTALGHLLTGRPITAVRAYELGLVNDVVPAGQLDACVDGWVQDLLSCSPLAVAATKEAAYRSLDGPLDRAFRTRYRAEERRLAGADALEGPRAFVEHRPPRWTGYPPSA
jgi:dehydration protein DpgD